MQIVIDILEEDVPSVQALMTIYLHFIDGKVCECSYPYKILPKGHGRLVDISKIDEDMIERDNPIIYLTINGEYIEAVSLDYINSLQTIIEAERSDKE